ncbi:Ankyrin repeat protein 1 [Giardia muris]|uniref:Ankyrin repeat protein 1 n=1 Tax=Giardia muris TaxID=5742 RepID=A0A4Z1T975_GIAMU|nr:Ankyrin repeat protein 1 [Giardia muris]|eukprot:TNJ29071.1 Ankyrin repeat protein 1 [Giardia muris]
MDAWFQAADTGDMLGLRQGVGVYAKSRDAEGRTALLRAITAGHLAAVQFLAPYEGMLPDKEGISPLVLAIRLNRIDFVHALILNPHQLDIEDIDAALASAPASSHLAELLVHTRRIVAILASSSTLDSSNLSVSPASKPATPAAPSPHTGIQSAVEISAVCNSQLRHMSPAIISSLSNMRTPGSVSTQKGSDLSLSQLRTPQAPSSELLLAPAVDLRPITSVISAQTSSVTPPVTDESPRGDELVTTTPPKSSRLAIRDFSPCANQLHNSGLNGEFKMSLDSAACSEIRKKSLETRESYPAVSSEESVHELSSKQASQTQETSQFWTKQQENDGKALLVVEDLEKKVEELCQQRHASEQLVTELQRRIAQLEQDVRIKNERIRRLEALLAEAGLSSMPEADLALSQSTTGTDPYGNTQLIQYAVLNDIEGVESCFNEVGRQNAIGQTALMTAAALNHYEVVRRLIPYEAGDRGVHDKTALMLAAEANAVESIVLLLEREAGMVMQKEDDPTVTGVTALMLAAERNHAHAVKLLAPKEAGMQRGDGETALMIAIEKGNDTCATLLCPLEAGRRTHSGDFALRRAVYKKRRGVIKYLLSAEDALLNSVGWTPLMIYTILGDLAAAQRHIKQDCGKRDTNGQTALMLSVILKHTQLTKALAPREAGIINKDGITALMYAVRHENMPAVRILAPLERGMRTFDGHTALDFIPPRSACRKKMRDLIALRPGTVEHRGK